MTPSQRQSRIKDTIKLLRHLGLPKAQQNERSALTLLALVNLSLDKTWNQAEAPMLGITQIMDWIKEKYHKNYAPNTRETVRRQTVHQFMQAGIVVINPDDSTRPINSPNTVYQICDLTLSLVKHFDSPDWDTMLKKYRKRRKPLSEKYAQEREQAKIPLYLESGEVFQLSPGEHSELIRNIVEDFGPRFVPGGTVVYVGDTGAKARYINEQILQSLDINLDKHGKMPDVILYFEEKRWLLLIEAVTGHGPVDMKRHEELIKLFVTDKAGLVFVTAFPTRTIMSRYLSEIAWETEVWIADSPSHLIHFNGERFLGPH